SLGVILYEMVTGQKPFPPKSENNGSARPPIPPSKLVKGLSRKWDKAILPCLAPDPQDRCSARAVQAELERKPLYRGLPVVLAMAACLVLAAVLAVPPIIHYFAPAPSRLAILPVEAPSNLDEQGNALLETVGK